MADLWQKVSRLIDLNPVCNKPPCESSPMHLIGRTSGAVAPLLRLLCGIARKALKSPLEALDSAVRCVFRLLQPSSYVRAALWHSHTQAVEFAGPGQCDLCCAAHSGYSLPTQRGWQWGYSRVASQQRPTGRGEAFPAHRYAQPEGVSSICSPCSVRDCRACAMLGRWAAQPPP